MGLFSRVTDLMETPPETKRVQRRGTQAREAANSKRKWLKAGTASKILHLKPQKDESRPAEEKKEPSNSRGGIRTGHCAVKRAN